MGIGTVVVPCSVPAGLWDNISIWVISLCGDVFVRDSLLAMVEEAFSKVDESFGEAEAVKWADGFVFHREVIQQSVELFNSVFCDFERLVGVVKSRVSHSRLSVESIKS